MDVLAILCLALALIPLVLTAANLRAYRSPAGTPPPGIAVSVLIPARNEEANIGACLDAVLASRGVAIEAVVMDDGSTDGTATVVAERAARDPRVRLERAPPLPPGWVGKQHACRALARAARHDVLLFLDADVRLAPDAVGRAAAFLARSGAGLVSGFPRQVTGSPGERLLVPMIHVLLLGYLPMGRMRRSRAPGLGAGCGQLMLARRDAYEAAGGHGAVPATLHDGVMLPRAFRRAGIATDLFDAAPIASCRMYRGFAETWEGFSKNATEGMARPVALPVWTALLLGGHVLPWILLLAGPDSAALPAGLAAAASLGQRVLLARRFEPDLRGALLQPFGVLAMLALQWTALLRARRSHPVAWRGRSYEPQA
ncbi:glycosyltransferase [Arenibaculum pallidiluteum]|uniref:glycosyltransferase n=1 Tax=Arenibaculum pallidiluteum TaxID=2812559 RepID=UPI001A956358|nr:glycosyltransferase family 2 protein [Arenibaculum pallidiluteum]